MIKRSVLVFLLALTVRAEEPRAKGQSLYRTNCAVCHDLSLTPSKKLGPSFHQVMSKKTRPYIVVRIKFGGPLMPAFGKTLTDGEINSLVDYLADIKPQTP